MVEAGAHSSRTRQSARLALRLTKITQNDDQKVKDYGVELAISTVNSLTNDKEIDVVGVHLCTLNLEKSVRRVLDGLGWSHESHRMSNQVIDVSFLASISTFLSMCIGC